MRQRVCVHVRERERRGEKRRTEWSGYVCACTTYHVAINSKERSVGDLGGKGSVSSCVMLKSATIIVINNNSNN